MKLDRDQKIKQIENAVNHGLPKKYLIQATTKDLDRIYEELHYCGWVKDNEHR